MEDLREKKNALRTELRKRAASMEENARSEADRAIRAAVLESREWREADTLFVYVSMWAEPDTRGLILEAFAAGKTVYVPRCYPGRVMKAVRIDGLDALRPGTLGIPEPVDDSVTAAPGELALAIVPCVSVSRDGRRLGHGAGYYDRFLARMGCRTLCLCYESLLSDEIPVGAHDVRMDAVVTEKGVFRG